MTTPHFFGRVFTTSPHFFGRLFAAKVLQNNQLCKIFSKKNVVSLLTYMILLNRLPVAGYCDWTFEGAPFVGGVGRRYYKIINCANFVVYFSCLIIQLLIPTRLSYTPSSILHRSHLVRILNVTEGCVQDTYRVFLSIHDSITGPCPKMTIR